MFLLVSAGFSLPDFYRFGLRLFFSTRSSNSDFTQQLRVVCAPVLKQEGQDLQQLQLETGFLRETDRPGCVCPVVDWALLRCQDQNRRWHKNGDTRLLIMNPNGTMIQLRHLVSSYQGWRETTYCTFICKHLVSGQDPQSCSRLLLRVYFCL